MISDGPGLVLRHSSGRYLTTDIGAGGNTTETWRANYLPAVWVFALVSNPLLAYRVTAREIFDRFLDGHDWRPVADQFEVVPGPGCNCCGERWNPMQSDGEAVHRCPKHVGRNPCAIEGCKRTTATTQGNYWNDTWLCGEHWRIAAPPGSPERRVFLRLFRLHRKIDGKDKPWSAKLEKRYWRIWSRIVAIGRARTAGDIDMDEINRLFGWE